MPAHIHAELMPQYAEDALTININGFEVPEPVREPLPCGTVYCVANISITTGPMQYRWSDDRIDFRFLREGLIHLTPEAAELHSKALLSFTARTIEP